MSNVAVAEGAGRWVMPVGLLVVLAAAEGLVVLAAGPALALPKVSNAVVLDLAVVGPALF